ncbi:MAG: YaaR family protein [Oscillospiraceae bacterium]|nr:YaaR family protein [Oscillospiraceae bacterium]
MRIRGVSAKTGGVGDRRRHTNMVVRPGSAATFEGVMMKADERNVETRLGDLAERIYEQGKKLGQKVDIAELRVYKAMISEFVSEAVAYSHKFTKESFLNRRGKHKVYSTVKKINDNLERLTAEVLMEEKDNIGILQKIEDIRGFILDLLL